MKLKKRKSLFIVGSVIIGITALLIVYFVLIATGAIQTRQYNLVFTTGSANKVYDGEVLTCDEWVLSSGELGEGYRVEATITGAQTEVGTSSNEMSVIIYDTEGADVTAKFAIECLPGTLTVSPIEITVYSESAEKVYDGVALTSRGKPKIYGTLLDGDRIDVTVVGSQTEVGSSENKIVARMYDSANKDVTSHYTVVEKLGKLTVSPIIISLRTYSAEKLYDGTPLKDNGWDWVTGRDDMLPEHGFTLLFTAELTNAGSIENTVTAIVSDSSGRDVTNCYKFNNINGTLTVWRVPISVYSGSADKIYDGLPLYCYDAGLESGSLVKGDSLNIKVHTSLTYPGAISNNVRISISDRNSVDVTKNYDIRTNFGTLTVYDPGNVVVAPGGKVEDVGGGEGGGEGGGGASLDQSGNISTEGMPEGGDKTDDIVFLRLNASEGGRVYLRDYSYGDYNGMKWGKAETFSEKADLLPLYLTSAALEGTGKNKHIINMETIQNNLPFFTPYYSTTYLTEGNDVHAGATSLTMRSQTTVEYIYFDYINEGFSGTHNKYSALEKRYSEFVYKNYLSVPVQTKSKLLSLAAANGLSAGSPTVVADVQKYISGAAKYNLSFSFPDTIDDIVIYFLTEAKEGICQHFASAATLMYRALGIPARYTTGFASEVQPNNYKDVTAKDAHAWVEIYINGLGWVEIEVTAGMGGSNGYDGSGDLPSVGDDSDMKNNEVLMSVSKAIEGDLYLRDKSYGDYYGKGWKDATAFYSGNINPLLMTAHASNISFGINVRHLKAGLPQISPIYAMYGYGSTNTDVHLGQSYLPAQTQYNNFYTDFDYFTQSGLVLPDYYQETEKEYSEFVREHYLSIPEQTKRTLLSIAAENGMDIKDASQIKKIRDFVRGAGEYTEQFDFGNTDDIVVDFLSKVKKGDSRCFASAATLMYRALGIPSRYVSGFLVRGKDFYNDVTSRNTHYWTEVYVTGLGWVRAEASPVTDLPLIKNVSVMPKETSKVYDGYTLRPEQALNASSEYLFGEGTYYNVKIEGAQTNVGTGRSTIEQLIVYDSHGNDITSRYNISYAEGSLIVYYSELVLKSTDISKEYDGTPLMGEDWELLSGELLPGHYFGSPTFSTSITNVIDSGYVNSFYVDVYDESGNYVNYYYKMTYVLGTLTITPRPITITTDSAEKEYDGTPLTDGGWSITDGSLLEGDSISYLYLSGTQTQAGSSKNTIHSCTITNSASGYNITYNYQLDYVLGDLTVTPRKITIETDSDNKQYDGTPLTAHDYEIVQGTLAAGDTLEPLTVTGTQTIVGESDNTIDESSIVIHNEYYVDATNNYVIEFEYGKLTVTDRVDPIELIVKPRDLRVVRTGSEFTPNGFDIIGGKLIDGDYLVVTYKGSRTDIGTSTSEISSCIAYDKSGNNVSNRYNFKFKTGKITVCYGRLNLHSNDAERDYDGTPLAEKTLRIENISALQSNHKIDYTFSGTRTDVGKSENAFDVKITDENGNDITNLYIIVRVFGSLTVKPTNITVTADSLERPYDGTTLTCGTYNIVGLPSGFIAEVVIEGSQTERGKSENRVKSVVVRDSMGNDVTRNFAVTSINGTLFVK